MNKILIIFIAISLISCGSNNKLMSPDLIPGPKAIIYKTKADYFDKVPIFLSEDKKTITGFPHPKDLMKGEKYSLPTPLIKGFLLDNRGIGQNTAFLKYSYDEYSKLNKAPNLEKLYDMILDPDPLLEIYELGQRTDFKSVNEINRYLRKNLNRIKKAK